MREGRTTENKKHTRIQSGRRQAAQGKRKHYARVCAALFVAFVNRSRQQHRDSS